MFFSISIAIYNAEKYLDDCIDSIINQTDQNFELILVDDGSKDKSVEICNKWINMYPNKIRLIKKENTGSLLTRRVCIEESKGEFLYIMDADDFLIDKKALEKIHRYIERYKYDILFFDCTINTKSKSQLFKFPFKNEQVYEGNSLYDIYKYHISHNGLKPLWNKVFSKKLIDREEDYSRYSSITNGTDFFQSTPIILRAKKILYINQVFYFYRTDNNESIVHTFKPSILYSGIQNFLRLRRELAKQKKLTKEFERLLGIAYLKMISTTVYKLRLIENDELKSDYLKRIKKDKMFNEYYPLRNKLPLKRSIILFLLYAEQYKILTFALSRVK